MNLDSYQECRIPGLPNAFYYLPDFITLEQEAALLAAIDAPRQKWTVLSHRRLQAIPSVLAKGTTLLDEPLPRWLEDVAQRLAPFFAGSPHARPNHCLVNEYLPGQGIMPHQDGAAYAPVVATVSLGSHTVLDVYEPDSGGRTQAKWRVYQQPRSLLVTRGDAYRELLHGIAPVDRDMDLSAAVNWHMAGAESEGELKAGSNGAGGHGKDDGTLSDAHDRGRRVSLTFRDVLKVSSAGRRVLGRSPG